VARPRLEHPEFVLRIRERIWYVHWTEDGRSRRASTRTGDIDEAETYKAQFIAEYERNHAPDRITINALLDGYLEGRRGRVRAIETLEHAAKPLRRLMGELAPDQIHDPAVARYARERRVEGRADGTIIRELGVLRAALHWAGRQDGWLNKIPKFIMPVNHPQSKNRWLTKDEARRLLDGCKSPHVRLFVMLGLYTGARKGAILGLEWEQVTDGLIDYGPGHGRKRRSKVPIHPVLRMELDEQQMTAASPYVIEYAGRPVRNIQHSFARAAEAAGLENVTPHVLRHTCATWQVMEGVPLRKVARMLGDTEKTIETVYGHHSPDYLQEAVSALDF
jgi:integrase